VINDLFILVRTCSIGLLRLDLIYGVLKKVSDSIVIQRFHNPQSLLDDREKNNRLSLPRKTDLVNSTTINTIWQTCLAIFVRDFSPPVGRQAYTGKWSRVFFRKRKHVKEIRLDQAVHKRISHKRLISRAPAIGDRQYCT